MYLVQKNHLRRVTKPTYRLLQQMCRTSKNLYNVTLWTVRQYWETNHAYLPYEEAYHLVKENENYQQLPSQVAQQTMKVVDRTFKAFFGLLKRKTQGTYNRPAHVPRYLPRDGYFVCIFQQNLLKVEGGRLRLSLGRYMTKTYGVRYLWLPIPPTVQGHPVKEVRVVPRCRGRYFEVEWVYETTSQVPAEPRHGYIAIDLGLDNFATCVASTGPAFILEGRGLKSFNRWWNKEKARVQRTYDRQGVQMGAKYAWLLCKRQHMIRNYMAQAVSYLVKYCLQYHIGTVVIGELRGIKQRLQLGRQTNQHFQYITYGLFKAKLRSKCALYGIKYVEVDEAYTSQTCARCGQRRTANRVHRGLYVCQQCGLCLHADVNGALNILHHVAPEATSQLGSSGRVSRPVRVRIVPIRGLPKLRLFGT
ncbi:MAG: RNA-guided endonuclease InsQ/TnpB family protein [Candidatus Hermodarchaeota archaeon]